MGGRERGKKFLMLRLALRLRRDEIIFALNEIYSGICETQKQASRCCEKNKFATLKPRSGRKRSASERD